MSPSSNPYLSCSSLSFPLCVLRCSHLQTSDCSSPVNLSFDYLICSTPVNKPNRGTGKVFFFLPCISFPSFVSLVLNKVNYYHRLSLNFPARNCQPWLQGKHVVPEQAWVMWVEGAGAAWGVSRGLSAHAEGKVESTELPISQHWVLF